MKGLAILLPAIITIALFAWAWDILRTNVVELSIRGIDSIAVFEPRRLSKDERDYLQRISEEKYLAYMKWAAEGWGGEIIANETLDEKEAYLLRLADLAARRKGLSESLEEVRLRGGGGRSGSKETAELEEQIRRLDALLLAGPDRVNILIRDLPDASWGYSPPLRPRGPLQYVLDANKWPREQDPDTGRVLSYHWFDYLLASLLGLVLVVLLGFGTRNFLGRRVVQLVEWFVTKTPVIRSVYPHAKQLFEFFFSDNKSIEFDTVCVVEYPRPGLWSIAFVTGAGLKTLQESTGKRMVTVYVPSSPAPMTGYTMFVAADEVLQLDITVEDAMKLVISGGVLAPKAELVRPASGAQFALAHSINEQVRHRHTQILRKAKSATMPAVKDTGHVPNREADSNRAEAAPPAGDDETKKAPS
ncbi:MAG: DUF502 domain-containing protein [Planctomycetes bacterium]|nr:DUF502 domain-containing protein [Planctomycetota bacterium]